MGVSLLFMHIPPPITFPLRILPLKKWIALAPSVGLNIGTDKARNTMVYCQPHVILLVLIDNFNSPVVGAGPSEKGQRADNL